MIDIFKPKTLDEAKKILNSEENIKVLAGGTDLIIDIRKNKYILDSLLDIGNIEELKNIEENDDSISIGARVTFSELKESEIIKNRCNSLYECSKTMGSPHIRNVATIGGNVANSASAADSIPCLMSLYSKIILESIDGVREVSLRDYFKNYNIEHLKKREIITKFIIPKKNSISGYYKLGKRNSLSIARISVAVGLTLKEDIVKDISVVVGAAGKVPFEVTDVKRVIINEKKEALFENEILNILENSVYNSIKGRNTVEFKKEAVKGVYKQALYNALKIEGV
ncbi:FAD binding domain-containing protein [Clostridium sp. D43t1_170807_H7]|uniref:FAD binding domain-containing protein n=1 Tax=Clostridium sp. D43t1_170807_H7 TaxID=2787140 RepID=UPI0018978F2A|nr:FAD binding domain-containing protein [Clostridium sp. D43t1_170807_H7]